MPTPYAGNDANYPTAVNILSGSDAPTSANFDTAFEGGLDRTASLQNRGTLSPLVTPQTPFTTQSFTSLSSAKGPHAIVWDGTSLLTDGIAGQRWLFLVKDSGGSHMQVFAGFPDSTIDAWVQVGGNVSYASPGTGTSMCVDTSGNIYIAGVGGISATEADIYLRAPGGSFASNLVISGVTGASDLQIATLGTALFYAVGSSTAGSASISGAFGGGFTGLTAATWIVRSSPSMVLFVPNVAMATPTIYKATGTATYTSATIGLATTDVPVDLTWSATWNQWVLLVKTSTGGTTVWTSPDGATWTLTKTMTTLGQPPAGIAAFGPHLVMTTDAPNQGNVSQLVTSSDGGVTWYVGPAAIQTNSATGPIRSRPVAGANRIFYGQTVGLGSAGSSNMRFSGASGRGDQAVT